MSGTNYHTLEDLRAAGVAWTGGDTITVSVDVDNSLIGSLDFGDNDVTVTGGGIIGPGADGVRFAKVGAGGALTLGAGSGETLVFMDFSTPSGDSGGAIHGENTITLSGGENIFINNQAALNGGAVYAAHDGAFIAGGGDILFQGNTAGGVANAVYMDNSAGGRTLILAAESNYSLLFHDPVTSNNVNPDLTIHINSVDDGATSTKGTVVFDGKYWIGQGKNPTDDADYFTSAVYGETTVHGGTLALKNGVTYGAADDAGTFTLKDGATLLGNAAYTNTIQAGTIALEAGSTLAFDLTGANDSSLNLSLKGGVTVGAIAVDFAAFNSKGVFNLATIDGNGVFANTNTYDLTTHGELIADTRAASQVTLGTDNGGKILTMTNNANNGVVYWTGAANNGKWDATSTNWDTETSSLGDSKKFLHGDAVVFGAQGDISDFTVTIQEAGVTIAAQPDKENHLNPGMEIRSDDVNPTWHFKGGEISGGDILLSSSNGITLIFDGVNGGASRDMGQRILVENGNATLKAANPNVVLTFSGFNTTGNGIDDQGVIRASPLSGGMTLHLGERDGGRLLFINNTALQGAAVNLLENANLILTDGNTFLANSVAADSGDASGGAIYGNRDITSFGDNTFTGNSATADSGDAYGGAISGRRSDPYQSPSITFQGYSNNSSVNTFADNSASSSSGDAYGGAIHSDGAITFRSDSVNTFTGNSAAADSGNAYGGAIYGAGVITLYENSVNTFTGNSAAFGGAIAGSSNVSITGGTNKFTNNSATTLGGAIWANNNGTFIANGVDLLFQGNTAGGVANAIYMNNSNNNTLILAATAGKEALFYDPVTSNAGNGNLEIAINNLPEHSGTVVFDGGYWAGQGKSPTDDSAFFTSAVHGDTTVSYGTLALRNGVTYGAGANVGSFALGGGATLATVGSTSTIQAGQITLANNSTLKFDLTGADKDDARLALSAAAYAVQVGTQKVEITSGPADLGGDAYLLATAGEGVVNPTGQLTYNNVVQNVARDGSTIKALTTDADRQNLYVQEVAMAGVGETLDLVWNGSVGASTWNTDDTNRNWLTEIDDTGKYMAINFVDGDSVIFDDTAALKTVTVADSDVEVGTMTVKGDYTFIGGTVEKKNDGSSKVFVKTGGALRMGDGGSTGMVAVDIEIEEDADLVFNRSDAVNYDETISGEGRLTQASGSTLTLSGTNSYSGGTIIEKGTIAISENVNLGTGALEIGNGTLQAADDDNDPGTTNEIEMARQIALNHADSAIQVNQGVSLTLNGGMDGDGNLNKRGEGALILTGNNTYGGNTTVAVGTLQIGDGVTGNLGGGNYGGNVANSGALIFNQSATQTLSGAISGTGSLTQSGSDVLILTGENTYTGGTFINRGAIAISSGGNLGTGTITINDGTLRATDTMTLALGVVLNTAASAIEVDAGKILTLDGDDLLTGDDDGVLNKKGDGALRNLAGFGGAVNIAAGTVEIATGTFNNALTGSGVLAVNRAAAADGFAFGDGVGGNFTGTVAMVKGGIALTEDNVAVLKGATLLLDDAGTTTVSKDTTIGNLTMDGGTLKFTSTAIGPDGLLTVKNLDVGGGGTVMMDLGQPIDTDLTGLESWYDYAGSAAAKQVQVVAVTGTTAGGALAWTDSAGEALGEGHTRMIVDGATDIGQATFGFAATAAVEDGADGLYLGYTLTELEAYADQNITLDSTDAGSTTPVIMAKLTGEGGFVLTGDKTATISNSANDYKGATTIDAAAVKMGADGVLGQTSVLALNGEAKLDMNGKSQTVGGLAGGAEAEIVLGTLTVNQKNGNSSYAGTLGGEGGSLIKDGEGVLTLFGTNTYTGATIISSGTFALAAGGSVAASSGVGVAAAAAFDISGIAGETAAVKALDGSGAVVLGAKNLNVTAGDGGNHSGVISGSGGFILSGGTQTLSGANTYAGDTTVNGGTLSIASDANIGGGTNTLSGGTINLTGEAYSKNWTLGAGTNTINNAGAATLNGVLGGSGGIGKIGDGVLTLTAANSHSGGTNIAAGTVEAKNASALGTGAVAVGANTALVLDFEGTLNAGNAISGDGALNIKNDVAIGHANAGFTGTTTVDAGKTLALGDEKALLKSAIDLGSASTLSVGQDSTVGSVAGNDITIAFSDPAHTLSAASFALTGSNTIAVDSETAGTYTLLASTDAVADWNAVVVNADDTVRGAQKATDTELQYKILAAGAADLTWTGAAGTNWNESDMNWTSGDGFAFAFQSGDNVVFDDGAGSKTVTVDAGGVSVGTMTVSDSAYTFGLTAGNTPAIAATGDVDLGGAVLNITGYAPDGSSPHDAPVNVQTVIASDGALTGFNGAVTVLDQANVDFLAASAYQDGDAIKVETRLGWYSTDPDREAHGDFTIGSDSFTLGAALNDNSASTNKRDDWDGDSLTKKGEGTLILTADNAYTGATAVSAGTLALTGGGSVAASSGVDVAADAAFDISGIAGETASVKELSGAGEARLGAKNLAVGDGDTSSTFSGVISGTTGSLTKTGTGTLTLTGANSYGGGTTIDGGTLIGNAASLRGDIVNNAAVVFDQAVDGRLDATITGDGGFTKRGAGLLDLDGALSVGQFTLEAGGVGVNLDDGETIAADTVSYVGGSVVVTKNNSADLARGQGNAVSYAVIEGTGADAFAAATSLVSSIDSIQYSIQADSGLLAMLLWLSNYNAGEVMEDLLNPDDLTGNLSGGGGYTDSVIDDLPLEAQDAVNDYIDIILDRDFSPDDALTAFKQLYGEHAAYARDGQRLSRRRFAGLIANWLDLRLATRRIESATTSRAPFSASSALASRAPEFPCEIGLANRIWGGGFGIGDRQDNRDGIAGYDFDGGGVILGYDHAAFDNFVLGFAGSYTRGRTKVDDLRTKYDADILNLGLYGEYAHDSGLFARFGLGFGYGWNDYDTRLVAGGTKRGKYHTQSYSANLEFGYRWALACNVNLTPSVGIDYTWLRNGSWRESAAGAGVANFYKSGHENIADIPLAVRVDKVFDLGGGRYVAPEIRLAYVVAAGDKRPAINGGYVGGPSGLIQKGVNVGASRVQLGAGLKAKFTDRVEGRLDYQFEVRSKYRGHTLSASFGVAF